MARKKKTTSSAKSKLLKSNHRSTLDLIAHPEITDTSANSQSTQQKALFSVIAKIRESLDLESIFKSTVIEVRQLLKADRVGIYRFDQASSFNCGEFVSEDGLPELPSALAAKVNDYCFRENYANHYQQGKIWACADIYEQGLSDCHIQILERFQVRANLIVPLLNGDRLWGLLCIHQCSAPRIWLDPEIDFVKQIAMHLDVALQHSEFVSQLRSQSEYLTRAVEQAVGREKVVAAIINKIRRSLDIDTIFRTTTDEVRQLLQSDRVAIYRFNPDWSGQFVVESMSAGAVSLMTAQDEHPEIKENIVDCGLKCLVDFTSTDTYLQATEGGDFSNYEAFRVCADIYTAGFSPCYIQVLEHYQARAYAIAAIYKGKELWGLLAAYQYTEPRHWQDSEVNLLIQIATQLGVAIQQAELFRQVQKRSTDLETTLEIELQKRSNELVRDAEQERALARVIERIRQTLDIDEIFLATTQEVRQNLNCDRVVVYRFFDDWSGEFVSESKADGWLSLEALAELNKIWADSHLQENQGGRYANHESFVINDIHAANLTECHIAILESYQIKAFMIAPVFVANKLWGLVAAYQNSGSRDWESTELRLLTQVGSQLGVAVQQAELLVQLKKAKDKADAASRAKGDFLAHMSHELRTPLNSILGFAQVLARDSLLNHTQKEHLGIIARSGEHLLTLLNDVLEMSKIEAGLIDLHPNSFDLYNLLNNLKEMFLLKANSKSLQLIFDFAADVPQYIQTDESKLRQVLINLVGNAVKFTEQGTVILQVSSRAISDRILHFQVADTGMGIASEELDHLFEAFVQTEIGRRSPDGTGLGMPISKRFVQLMGGDIWVESTWGKGTIVNFDIKVQMANINDVPSPKVKRHAIGLAPNQPKYRILLADDKWESRHLMKNLLAPLEFEIREAENGQEAIALWQSWQPHLIWMDMQMPVIDGYEATRTIRATESTEFYKAESRAACKIVALTASVFDKQRSVILDMGCDDFVSKPLREELIFDKIAEHLGVVYTYAESNQPPPSPVQASDQLDQLIMKELNSLELKWLIALNLAARSADEEMIFDLLAQIQPTHLAIVNVIQDLVENFYLEQLVQLIQPFLELQTDES